MSIESEIGRELKASELKAGTVVAIAPPGAANTMITMWVLYRNAKVVYFVAEVNAVKWHVVNFVQPDDSLVDDKQRVVRVYEYLGEI